MLCAASLFLKIATTPGTVLQGGSRRLKRAVDIGVRMRRRDRPLLAGQGEVKDPLFQQCQTVAPIEVEIVMGQDVMPVGRLAFLEIDTKG